MPFYTRATPTADPLAVSLGMINWSYDLAIAAVTLAPTSQTIHISALWLPGGVQVGTLWFGISTPAAGTVPTSIIIGLENGATIVTQSAELKNNTGWLTGGVQKFPIVPFTPPQGGFYRGCFWQNGAWGTTQLALANRTVAGLNTTAQALAYVPWHTGGTSVAAFPANGAALPSIVFGTNALWIGAGP